LKRKPARGPALDEFALLVEGLLYGLLEPETYDLAAYGLDFDNDEDRYFTVLKFRSAQGAEETVAGAFSPDTLVCPAGNWRQKEELEHRVQDVRFTVGPNARALLRAFMAELPARGMLWYSAMEWLVDEYSAARDEATLNQRNVGPLHLRLSAASKPRLVFFPQYSPNYLSVMVQCLNAENYVSAADTIHLEHQGWRLMSLNMKKQDKRPKLLGMGGATLRDADSHHLPVQTTINGGAEQHYLRAVAAVANLYASEVENPSRRFTIPDALRVGFFVWGEAAVQKFVTGLQWIYGPKTHQAGMDPKPHLIVAREGPYSDEKHSFFVSRTPSGKLAYYVEKYDPLELKELSGLGYALWRIFLGANWDPNLGTAIDKDGAVCLAMINGWLGGPATMEPKPPEPEFEGQSWSTFLTLPGRAQEGLFKAAADAYIKRYGPTDSVAKERVRFVQVTISGYQWWQSNAV
jgi:hypothetical protein